MTTSRETHRAYTAAHEAAAFSDISAHGWLRLTGRDRLDLLHRLSTNNLRPLIPGQGLPTVLTSPIGRVMALLMVYADAAAIFVRTQPGQAAGVARYLNSMIFWQDQVEVADLSSQMAQFGLYGPQAGAALAAVSGLAPADVPPYGWRAAEIASAAVALHRGGPLEAWAYSVVTVGGAAGAVEGALSTHAPLLAPAEVDLLRIEAGLPLWGHELSDQVTPLETGLLPAISFTKGCYTGQEVIARQINYDKVTRNLVGLVLPPDATDEWAGAKMTADGGRGGFVGSVTWSPALGRPIALAVVPRELAEPGSRMTVDQDGQKWMATVTGLPFVTSNQ